MPPAGTATSTRDLRSLLGEPLRGAHSRRYCGHGDLAACRASLWAVIQASADATAERIEFRPGLLPLTMRWVNRPTYQQLMEFDGHR